MLSIVIPVLNEAENITLCYERIKSAMQGFAAELEILFVDDGSTDGTTDEIARLFRLDSVVKLIRLSRNFGHQMALTADLDAARGDVVITMDGDLQHPPELIPEMLRQWQQGSDIVYTIRQLDRSFSLKTLLGKCFYILFRRLSRLALPPSATDFRLLDRKVLTSLSAIRERNRFLRGLISWTSFRSTGLTYVAAP